MTWNSDRESRLRVASVVSVLLLFVCAIAAQEQTVIASSPRLVSSSLRLVIDKIESTQFGYDVTVKVINGSKRPLTFAVATTLSGMALQSLDVQQWDDTVGWESAGPCRDVPPSASVTLQPKATMWQVVPIFDTNRTYGTVVCPRKVKGLGGSVRAVLYFAYENQLAFERRKPALQNIVSDPVELPRVGESGSRQRYIAISPRPVKISGQERFSEGHKGFH